MENKQSQRPVGQYQEAQQMCKISSSKMRRERKGNQKNEATNFSKLVGSITLLF